MNFLKKMMLNLMALCGLGFGFIAQAGVADVLQKSKAYAVSIINKDTASKAYTYAKTNGGGLLFDGIVFAGIPYVATTHAIEGTKKGLQLKKAVFYEQEYAYAKYGLFGLSAALALQPLVTGSKISNETYNKGLMFVGATAVAAKLFAALFNRFVVTKYEDVQLKGLLIPVNSSKEPVLNKNPTEAEQMKHAENVKNHYKGKAGFTEKLHIYLTNLKVELPKDFKAVNIPAQDVNEGYITKYRTALAHEIETLKNLATANEPKARIQDIQEFASNIKNTSMLATFTGLAGVGLVNYLMTGSVVKK